MKAVMKANEHCVKSVQMRSFLWSVFSRIRAEYGDLRSTGKYGPGKNSVFGHFSHSGNRQLLFFKFKERGLLFLDILVTRKSNFQ